MDDLYDEDIERKIAAVKMEIREKIAYLTETNLYLIHSEQFKIAWNITENYFTDEVLESYGLTRADKNAVHKRVLVEAISAGAASHAVLDHQNLQKFDRDLLARQFRYTVPDLIHKHLSEVSKVKSVRTIAPPQVLAPIINISFAALDEQDNEAIAREFGTNIEYARYAKVIDALADNKFINELSLDDFNRMHLDVLQLKLRASKDIKQGQSGRESVLTDDPKKTVNTETAANYSVRLHALHGIAFKRGFTSVNPSVVTRRLHSTIRKKLKKYTPITDSEAAEKAFTPEDLHKIFTGYLYNKTDKAPTREVHPYHYWLPLLALYSGARINELSQLNVDDVILEGQTANYKVEADDPDLVNEPRSLKSLSSKRRVPIHKHILELGFAEYVSERKRKKHKKLFGGLKYNKKNKWGSDATQFFTRLDNNTGGYFKKVNVHTSALDGKVFHSFRHLFISKLRNEVLMDMQNSQYVIESITGHERISVSEADRYGTGIELTRKKDFVNQLNFNIDVISYDEFKNKFISRLVL